MIKKMKSNEILWSVGKNDECNTPRYAIEPLIKYLPKNKIIWCPFDDKESQFVKVLLENDFKIEYSHIFGGKDFYNYEPNHWDIMVSNPPFTNKRKIFERALSFGKPFALLMSLVWLNDSAPIKIFGNELQLLMFDKRILFENNGVVNKKITFSSAYFCKNLLPSAICVESITRD